MSFWKKLGRMFKRMGKKIATGARRIGKKVAPVIHKIKKVKDTISPYIGLISKVPVVGKYAKTAFDVLEKPIDVADGVTTGIEKASKKDYKGGAEAILGSFS